MKPKFLTIIMLLFFTLSGCQKAGVSSMPDNLTASQGTYINLIMVEWKPDKNVPGYIVLWAGNPDGNWHGNGYGSSMPQEEPRYVDTGESYNTGQDVVSFKHYYRVFACEDIEVKSECAKTDGYSAIIEKAVVTGITRSPDLRTITVTWDDQNPRFLNETMRSYQICIEEETENIRTQYNYLGTNLSFQVPNRDVDLKYKVAVNIKFEYDTFSEWSDICYLNGDYVLEE